MSMHVTEGPFWETGAATRHQNVLLNICCFVPDGEMSRKWPLSYLFIFFLKEKPFGSLTTANLFSLLPSFAPFFHSCFPYPSPHFGLMSAVNIHEARCSDGGGGGGRRNMKGFSETNYSASLTQNVSPAFFVLFGSVLSWRDDSLKNKGKMHFRCLVAFLQLWLKGQQWFSLRCSPHPQPV